MRLICIILPAILNLLVTTFSSAQTVPEKLDSLQKALTSAKTDTNKVLLLCEISANYFLEDPEQGIVYGKKALDLAKKLHYDYGIIKSHNVTARCYAIRNDYPEALRHFQAALAGAERLKSPRMVAALAVSLGAVYSNKEEYDKALAYLMKARDAYEKAGIANNSSLYTNIGYSYFKQKKYHEALTWYLEGIESGKKNQANADEMAMLYSNAAGMYSMLRDYAKALEYYYLALAQHQLAGDSKSAAVTLNGIADAYLGAVKNPANLPDSLKASQSNLVKAKKCMEQSLALSRELGLKDVALEVYSNYVDYYEFKGNYKDAYIYYRKHTLLKDSLRDVNEEKKFAKIEAEFLFQGKTDSLKFENQLKDGEIQRKKQERNGSVALISLAAAIGLLVINRQKLKHKQKTKLAEAEVKYTREKARQQLEAFTKNIQDKNELIEQFTIEIEKYQVLPCSNELPEKDRSLKALQDSVILTEDQWVDFQLLFETVHPGYINRANQKFDNLTPADLRFVLLTRLGLGNKEMAAMLGVGPEAIRVARYRLLRKIRLPEGAGLEETVLAV